MIDCQRVSLLKDICMERNLTVWETFEFYGMLYKMDKKQIKSKIAELDKFLQLPHMNSFIGDIR